MYILEQQPHSLLVTITYDWFFHEHDMFGVFASVLGWLEYEKCKGNPRPIPSPMTGTQINYNLLQGDKKKNKWIRRHTSALLSAFFSKSRINFADFAGQRPCPLECLFLAWAVRPTPLQKRVNGIACLCARTSSKYLLALIKGNLRMACAVSLVFCCTHKKHYKQDDWQQQYHISRRKIIYGPNWYRRPPSMIFRQNSLKLLTISSPLTNTREEMQNTISRSTALNWEKVLGSNYNYAVWIPSNQTI